MQKKIAQQLRRSMMNKASSNDRTDLGHNIHASQVHNLCPRQVAICNKEEVHALDTQPIYFGLAVTFEIGHHFQSIILNHLGLMLVGRWVCPVCGNKTDGHRPEECFQCKGKRLNYIDYPLDVPIVEGNIELKGHVDAIVYDMHEHVGYPAEIKSIAACPANPKYAKDKNRYFSSIEEPSLDYESQIKTYLWMIKQNRKNPFLKKFNVSSKKGFIIYLSKGHNKNPIKIFEVNRDTGYDRKLKGQVQQLQTFAETSEYPPAICSTPLNPLAKECVVKDRCFEERD